MLVTFLFLSVPSNDPFLGFMAFLFLTGAGVSGQELLVSYLRGQEH